MENGYRDSAGVNATVAFCGRYSLNSMASSFVIKAGQIRAFDLKLQV
jgi:hypothetical protein